MKTLREPAPNAFKTMNSPVGKLTLVADKLGLVAILWANDDPKRIRLTTLIENEHHPTLLETERQLDEYFTGRRDTFTMPLAPRGTAFQKQVWQALSTIGYGETRSYADIARQIGRPSAVRAVGAANGKNPLSIIVPCHRVIGSDGRLTGFAGGLKIKAALLQIEAGGKLPLGH